MIGEQNAVRVLGCRDLRYGFPGGCAHEAAVSARLLDVAPLRKVSRNRGAPSVLATLIAGQLTPPPPGSATGISLTARATARTVLGSEVMTLRVVTCGYDGSPGFRAR
jgi:hypothetical protein